MELFDSHAHYNDEGFDDDYKEVVENNYNNGIKKTACIGFGLESSKKAIKIANEFEYIYSTCGISPNDINENVFNEIEEIEEMASDKTVVAIGEIGLDYHYGKDIKELQKQVFIKQIELANKLELPICIHTRDAHIDTIDILKNVCKCEKTGIFHCCPLNVELIKEGLKLGYYISFSGVVTFKNSKSELAIKEVPLDRLLIETDSPYLAPEPYRGKRNNPGYVEFVARKIAEIKGIDFETVAKATYDNAMRIYGIKE